MMMNANIAINFERVTFQILMLIVAQIHKIYSKRYTRKGYQKQNAGDEMERFVIIV